MTCLKRALALVLMLALACAPGAFAEESADNGLIRVYLVSLSEKTSLYVTAAGEYVIEAPVGMQITRGTEMIIAADGENVLLDAGGLTLNMGREFTLVRCAADEGSENGLYIHESERHALYEGDLRIGNVDGKLACILSIAMEDYLCGVVGYEMSDSFPLEALKAQAVAARTYAMNKRAARTDKEYDVTDTTTDQVFKGFIGDYTNVIRAVEETRGLVGMYNGKYAACYYTASNGGQVATPGQIWGGDGDYGYIEMKDDPYDLENASSLVNSIAVPEAYDGDNALWQLIMQRLTVADCEEFRADSIAAMRLSEPVYEGSRMFRTLEADIKVSVRRRELAETGYIGDGSYGWPGSLHIDGKWYAMSLTDWEALDAPVTVRLDVYDDIKASLGLGLNSRDYEVCTAVYSEGVYSVEMRRFGHGVGMSQRGAQTMAGEYGKRFDEILGFYYPGMQLVQLEYVEKPLSNKRALPDALYSGRMLIPPAAGDMGPLAEGEYYVIVTLDGVKSRLNVRSQPGMDSAVVAMLNDGYRLVVTGSTGDGWLQIRGAGFTGYVKDDYAEAE